jgi:hypothetical protein
MADVAKPRKITAEKRAKIGVDGFYNVDRNTFLTKTERAMELGRKKGLHYDKEYGLVSSDPAAIQAFILANDLKPLASGILDSTPPSAASSGGSTGMKSPKPAKEASSSSFMERVDKSLQALEAGKFLNLSTMRQVKEGKKDLLYNKRYSLAAKLADKKLLNETIISLGGSAGGQEPEEEDIGASVSTEVRAPDPTSRRVGTRSIFEKRLFGTQAALNAVAAEGSLVKSAVPVIAEESKEAIVLEETLASTPSAVIAPMAALVVTAPPEVVKRPAIEIRPVSNPIAKPVTGSFSFATKTPLKTSFTLAKPIIAPMK